MHQCTSIIITSFHLFQRTIFNNGSGFPIVGKGMGEAPANPTTFFENLPIKADSPHMKFPPSEKHPPPPPPLKCEVPFHEMIPRKSPINNNLQSS